jgi:hypothetical protein
MFKQKNFEPFNRRRDESSRFRSAAYRVQVHRHKKKIVELQSRLQVQPFEQRPL